MTADFISRTVTISITPEAFAAIEATLPKGTKGVPRLDGKGGYLVVLPHGSVGADESHSNVILRIAKGEKDALWRARFASGFFSVSTTHHFGTRPSVLYWLHPERGRDDFHS
jgi:hypothetical protein